MNCNDEKLKDIMSSVIYFALTKKYSSDYHYGLHQQINDLNIYKSIKWIMNDIYYKKSLDDNHPSKRKNSW